MLPILLAVAATLVIFLPALNFLSYRIMGGIIRNRRETWDLNICCGKTDGGGVNVDIVKHAEVVNLIVVTGLQWKYSASLHRNGWTWRKHLSNSHHASDA